MSKKRKAQIKRKRRKVYKPGPPSKKRGAIAHIVTDAEAAEYKRAHQEGVEARARMLGIPEHLAKSQEAGHSLGRLLLNQVQQKKISRETMSDYLMAGEHFGRVVISYDKDVLDSPRSTPAGVNLHAIGGRSCREITKEYIDGITASYMQIKGCLLLEKGRNIEKALRSCCIEDNDTFFWPDEQIKDLLKGLELISNMLTMGRKSGTGLVARRIAS